ncbi:hypothetical protein ACU5JM_16670 [Rhodococcus erythropolis]|uniref:hypothetical protein n=1 Tax=Rhodococcus erythropolis TaxID=1833 RepID=UPI00406BCDB8
MATRNFRHSKCYANTDGGCSSKISGEHYISHSLIKLYTFDDPDVTIQHDHGLGVRRPVQPKKFVANVLCEAHNNGLSGADAAALQFATFLRTIAIRYRGGSGEWGTDESVEISGDDFQRWVLKLLLTHASAGAFASDETVVKGPIPDDSIHLLLDRAEWPRTWGLYVASDVTNQHLRFDPFSRVETVTTDWWSAYPKFAAADSAIYGGIVELAGVGFGLSFFNQGRELSENDVPESPVWGSIQRPCSMAWVLNGVAKRVNFTWSDPYHHRSITYTMNR